MIEGSLVAPLFYETLWSLAIGYVVLHVPSKGLFSGKSLLLLVLSFVCAAHTLSLSTTISWLVEGKPFIALAYLCLVLSVGAYTLSVSHAKSTKPTDH